MPQLRPDSIRPITGRHESPQSFFVFDCSFPVLLLFVVLLWFFFCRMFFCASFLFVCLCSFLFVCALLFVYALLFFVYALIFICSLLFFVYALSRASSRTNKQHRFIFISVAEIYIHVPFHACFHTLKQILIPRLLFSTKLDFHILTCFFLQNHTQQCHNEETCVFRRWWIFINGGRWCQTTWCDRQA